MKMIFRQRMLMLLTLLFGAVSGALATDRFYLEPLNIEPGETKQLRFVLENSQDFFGFQTDITLPEGLDFVKTNGKVEFSLSDRADHSFTTVSNLVTEKSLRVGAFSTQHHAFTGNTGELLTIKVRASETFSGGQLSLHNIHFADALNQDVKIADQTFRVGNVHNNHCTIPDFKINVGETKTITLHLENESLLTAFQLDLYFPQGLQLVENSFVVSSRCSADHKVTARDNGDGHVRIACFSVSNTAFLGNKGGLIDFKVKADKTIGKNVTLELKQLVFSTIDAQELVLANSVTSIVTERALVENITLDQTALTINVGDSKEVKATIAPSFASTKELTWTSNHPEIAEVSSQGVVKALKVGTATITATATDGSNVSASCEVTVNGIPVKGITLNKPSITLKATENVQLTATITPINATDQTLTWHSENESVAKVDSTGKVTGISMGKTQIIVSSVSNPKIQAICNVTIAPTLVNRIVIEPTQSTLKAGETIKLQAKIYPELATNKTVSWLSEDQDIAIVDSMGKVTAKRVGQVRIEVNTTDGSKVKAYAQIHVVPTPVESITIVAEGDTKLKAGETLNLRAEVLPVTATDKTVTWSSITPEVASVDLVGKVTAHKVGKAIIKATAGGISSTIEVTVLPTLATGIKLNRSTLALKVAGTAQLSVAFTPATTTNKEIIWKSSNANIAKVSPEGLVTALNLGECDIIATTKDSSNLSDICHLVVGETQAESITITPHGPFTLKIGEKIQFTAKVLPETTTNKSISWTSQTSAVTIDQNGLAVAVAPVKNNWIEAINSAGQYDYVYITVLPNLVTAIETDKSAVTLKMGESVKVNAKALPENATHKTLAWSSKDTDIATVDQDGNIKACALGETIVTVKATDGSEVAKIISVKVVPTTVESITIVAEGDTKLKAGETLNLRAEVLPVTATDKTVTWSSITPEVASVDLVGKVTAHKVGKAIIKATAGGISSTIEVTVLPTLATGIKLNRSTLALKVAGTAQLSVAFTPATTTNKEIIWKSSNANIAKVSPEGLVTALNLGECDIIATTKDSSNLSDICHLVVGETQAESITITPHGPFTLKIGEKIQFTAKVLPETTTNKSISWTSQTSAVTIDQNGLAVAVAPVKNNWIEAINSAGQYDYVYITVLPNLVTAIETDKSAVTLKMGESVKVNAKALPENATHKTLAWSSKDTDIATVDQDGNIKACALGETIVTVKATDGSEVAKIISVKVVSTPVESITIVGEGNTKLKAGETLNLRAEVLPVTASDTILVWSSSNEEIATVQDGLVTAHHQTGTVTITAASGNGIKGTINLTIIPTPVDSLIISAPSNEMKVGDTQQIAVTINPSTATDSLLVWSSSDENILTVDQNGQVKAVAPGTAIIQAQSSNGVSAFVQITVKPILITSIAIPTTLTLEVGNKQKIIPEIAPENASNKFLTWHSSNEAVAIIVEGYVVARGIGEAILTCSATDGSGVSDSCTITVVRYADSVTISMPEAKLEVGATARLVAKLHPIDATNSELVWESSNKSVVTVSQEGLLEAIAEGEADVIVHTQEPHYVADTCHVTVEVKTDISSVTLDNVKIIHEDKCIIVKNCSDAQLYDLSGKKYIGESGYQEMKFIVPITGAYIVKVGKHALKIIIK